MPAESSPTHTIASANTAKGAVRVPIPHVTKAATGPQTALLPVATGSDRVAGSGRRSHTTAATAAINAATGNPYTNVLKLECVAVTRWTYMVQSAYDSTNRGTIRSRAPFSANRMSSPA